MPTKNDLIDAPREISQEINLNRDAAMFLAEQIAHLERLLSPALRPEDGSKNITSDAITRNTMHGSALRDARAITDQSIERIKQMINRLEI